jgi:hypothetical protein
MTVEEILDDIVLRLTKEVFERYGEPGILRVMNRQYKAFNRDMQVLEKSTIFNDGGGGTSPFTLPNDYGKEFDIVDENEDPLTYIDYDLFDDDEDGMYSIRGNQIFFGNFDATNNEFTMSYYSTGNKLVIDGSGGGGALASDEASTPEWVNSHELLFYSVVAELQGLNEMELLTFKTTKENLARTHYDKQGSTPARTHPHSTAPKNKYIDDYEYPYTRHT